MSRHASVFAISRDDYDAVIFDLDGVVTKTARIHASAWKQLFDAYLKERSIREGERFKPFDSIKDYLRYVDGKPRYEGVMSFLESRGIKLPYGSPDDEPDKETVCGLGNKKNLLFREHLEKPNVEVEVFDSAIRLIKALKSEGIKTAVVSSSKNCVTILEVAKLSDLFDLKLDGVDAARLRLAGKPSPDMFLKAAEQLKVSPQRAIVVEDAIVGVQAGRKGHFGCVIGVNNAEHIPALKENGADVAVLDLRAIAVARATQAPGGHSRASPWSLIYEDLDAREEGLREALCTLGNGYFATRGAAAESGADEIHYPGTYIAGGYNRLRSKIAGRVIENEDLVNMPNWLPLTFRIAGGRWFNPMALEVLSYRQELDLRRGLLIRTVRFRDKQGRQSKLISRRLVSMSDPHLAALETTLIAENWSGRIEMRSALDGRVVNAGVKRYMDLNNKHLEPIETAEVDEETIYLKVQTNQSGIRVAQAARTRVFQDGEIISLERRTTQEQGYIAHRFAFDVKQGSEVRVEKVVALFTSRDRGISECGLDARRAIARAGSFSDLLKPHAIAWKHLWLRCNLDLTLSETKQSKQTLLILHLHAFHLLQTTSMHTIGLDVGVPPRGWHGEAYRGHIFWDELFIFPLLNIHFPEITRALLVYRYRCLNEARLAASAAGYHGAMYPWQSGSSGREENQQLHLNPRSGRWVPDYTHLQRHVSAAIAYNIWQYYEVTRDVEFLSSYGAEMMLDIARFWASIATYSHDLDRYEILGVMGPDEYHDSYPDSDKPGLNNNAYTNVMVTWLLCRAQEILDELPEERRGELRETLNLHQEDFDLWRDISRKMRVPFHDGSIISQFEGYEELEEFDWEGYRQKYRDIQRLDRILEAEGDTPNRYKVSKQADVLMLFFLFSFEELSQLFYRLGYPFDRDTVLKNIEYYSKRVSHGSTLSYIVHSCVLARIDPATSWEFFIKALESDVKDIQGGTTPEGIHLGCMTGTVALVQRSYGGVVTRDGVLWLDPCLPRQISRLHIKIRYLGSSFELRVSHEKLRIRLRRCAAETARIGFQDKVYDLKEGDIKEFTL